MLQRPPPADVLAAGDLGARRVLAADVAGVDAHVGHAPLPAGGDVVGDPQRRADAVHRRATKQHMPRVKRDVSAASGPLARRAEVEAAVAGEGRLVAQLRLVHHPGRDLLGRAV